MPELDEYAKGAQFGWTLAWSWASHIANRSGAEGVVKACRPDNTIGVQPRADGPFSLYCFDCGEWTPDTANHEMRKEGMFAASHCCRGVTDGR